MRGLLIAAALFAASAVTACASPQTGEEPAWFAQREAATENTYPSLQSVPRDTDANLDAAYWAQLQQDMVAAGAAVRSNPRAQPATAAEDPNAFLEEARRELEQARLAHEPH